MKLFRSNMLAGVFLTGVLWSPAWAARTALPGTVNYFEGHAAAGHQVLAPQSIGSTILQPGQSLTTSNGKAEVLLTPGVFFRLGDSSSARMVSSGLADTTVALDRGQALVEVTEIHRENNLRITENGVSAQLVKTGLYGFDATHGQVRVFSGKALVLDGDRYIKVGGGHQVTITSPENIHPQKFDKKEYQQSDLYRWSSLRSSYLAEANIDSARVYVANGWYGPGWIGPGWYWNPWFGTYTFIPADGIFWSPFGWGFYSPLFVFRAPVVFVGRPFVRQDFRTFVHHPVSLNGTNVGRGFHPAIGPRAPFGRGGAPPAPASRQHRAGGMRG